MKFWPGYEVLTRVWRFDQGRKFDTGMKYAVLYPGMKFCTQEWSFVPRNEVLYPGMKFCTQEW
jgi:hypothetical protein